MCTTPYEKVHGTKPDLGGLHKWGCRVWVKIEGRSKLDAQADKGRFVGYSAESKGILVYWPTKQKVSVECNVRWDDSPVPDVIIDDNDSPNDNARTLACSAKGAGRTSAPGALDTTPLNAVDASRLKTESREPTSILGGQQDNVVPAQLDASATRGQNLPVTPDYIPKCSNSPHSVETTRPRRTPKPSEYIRRLEQGEGTTTGSARAPAVPRGMQASKDPKPDLESNPVDSAQPMKRPMKRSWRRWRC
ncbi:hypothetical protein HETIRDRAFT_118720 [Heterobasidion irregulare TC 32-1]|uniref:Retroviral polymerase SH3-like domain-containing protein n=1 Tax=Heterobasidion irregulare (strain TC 32-1) TaxID=747525 RepID=W4JU28_HETIT|nr:uncharacterized protein HETIRDRAFT_118720 [Heterobasidion irregulare TC 32-1]ETW76371.1 hypothetical protein HETIRDRAFT_118720 [Heterobasidion irregulare TC 32-1]